MEPKCAHPDCPLTPAYTYQPDGSKRYDLTCTMHKEKPVHEPAGETVLDEAAQIVDGPRRHTYGHPRDNHARTAAIWTAQLSRKLKPGERITPRDVCLLNAGQKLAREVNRPHRDNLVDLAGWARNAELVDEAPEGGDEVAV